MPVERPNRTVDTDNIQGSIWPRLPKEYESYLFFKITDKERFRQHLRAILDRGFITTGSECEDHLKTIGEFEEACAHSRRAVPEQEKKPFTAVNVAFTHVGLLKVEHPEVEVNFAQALEDDPDEVCTDRINEGLFEKGMFDDLVYEGADNPAAMDPNFRAPPGHESKTGLERWKWRTDGVFIVAAHNSKALRRRIMDLEDAFNVGDPEASSMRIAFRKDGRVRPGANRGKEHFGYEDHISQPKIDGLDDPPAPGEPQACPPGYIFLGHEGDPDKRRGPKWAKEGSYLVFRQLDQKVPEFQKDLIAMAEEIPGNYGGNPEKLGAHLMGRWKSGAPVAKTPHQDEPRYAFDNDFDFRPKKDLKGCPFAAHIRKMRPRADKKRDIGSEKDDENHKTLPLSIEEQDEDFDEGQKEDASVILRRGITFGPELTEEEISTGKTIEQRGIYFTCYQSLIRDGFNFLMTRWASNHGFPEDKAEVCPDGPGMDPFINQKLRADHPDGYISLHDGGNPGAAVKLGLSHTPWVDQRGGEYFFTPSIRALREQFSADIVKTEGESGSESELPYKSPEVKELEAKVKELEQEQKALLKITEERVADLENLEYQLKQSKELHAKYVEENKRASFLGYAGLIHLDFLKELDTARLRDLKQEVETALAKLAGDVEWTEWQEIIRGLNSKYGFDLKYGNGGHYEGRNWREWKNIHFSTSESNYDRAVAYRNRMGQWCNNTTWSAAGGDAAGCALMWITFVIQLHDVLQVYRPEV
ncbi:hypothetical protein BDV38DRAFT_289477 [Aspergillus pseudotamarii]|uniref:DyP dimeric alpha+beta barrel domain-containing protein n=1 Tax=Aspergillus pseudotamarii TaxID=132259 RepID=A0A5N6TB95_ASPPS|nr:uncharacterized protein BDV38DRAFT_289477 [Aspergillus pseudotamarii]KAE8143537.1 hypothetical protein BDV38DRAFT_289477 [Aspergillus pseudotamarii]